MGCPGFLSTVLPSIGEEVELWDLVQAMMDQQGVGEEGTTNGKVRRKRKLHKEGSKSDSGRIQQHNDSETHPRQQQQQRIETATTTRMPMHNMASGVATAKLPANSSDQDCNKMEESNHIPDFPKLRKRRLSNSQPKFRIGVDASAWLYKAIHGFSDRLADERLLTRHGRADIYQEKQFRRQEDHQQQKQQPSKAELGSTSSAPPPPHNQKHAKNTSFPPAPPEQQIDEYVQACVSYVLKRIQKLQNFHPKLVQILIVLDGATPPAKVDQMDGWKQNDHAKHPPVITDNVARGSKVLRSVSSGGDTTTHSDHQLKHTSTKQHQQKQQHSQFQRAGAGPYFRQILYQLVAALRQNKVAFMIAPYKADSQLAYLAQSNMIDLVITEDSDLIALDADAILYKFDIQTNKVPDHHRQQQHEQPTYTETIKGVLVQGMADLGCCCSHGIDFLDFTPVMLVVTFVAAGCDYCPSLKNISLKTACRLVRTAFLEPRDTTKYPSALDLLFHSLVDRSRRWCFMISRQVHAYKQQFLAALLMYRHPVVFDPLLRARVVPEWRNLKMDRCSDVGTPDYACPHSIGPVRTSDTGRGGFMLSSTGRDSVDSVVPLYARIRGDPELLDHKAYRKLCNDWPKRQSIAGVFVPSEEAIRLAEGAYYTDKDAWKEEAARIAHVQQLQNEAAVNPQNCGTDDREADAAKADTATTKDPTAMNEGDPETRDAPGILVAGAGAMQESVQEEESQPTMQPPQTNAGGCTSNNLDAEGMQESGQIDVSQPEALVQTRPDNDDADGFAPEIQDDPAISDARNAQDRSHQFETQLQSTEDDPLSAAYEFDMDAAPELLRLSVPLQATAASEEIESDATASDVTETPHFIRLSDLLVTYVDC